MIIENQTTKNKKICSPTDTEEELAVCISENFITVLNPSYVNLILSI